MHTHIYSVPGVSCEHCVKAITTEVTKLDGVRTVDVDLIAKKVTIVANDGVADSALRAAIDDAGFDIVA
jgi:copper chaperone